MSMALRAHCETCDWDESAAELWKVERAAEEHQQENPDHMVHLERPEADLNEYR